MQTYIDIIFEVTFFVLPLWWVGTYGCLLVQSLYKHIWRLIKYIIKKPLPQWISKPSVPAIMCTVSLFMFQIIFATMLAKSEVFTGFIDTNPIAHKLEITPQIAIQLYITILILISYFKFLAMRLIVNDKKLLSYSIDGATVATLVVDDARPQSKGDSHNDSKN